MNEQEHREDAIMHYVVDPEFGTGECFRRHAELFPQYISDFFALAIMPDVEDTGEDLSAEDLAAVDRAWLKFKASKVAPEKAKNRTVRTEQMPKTPPGSSEAIALGCICPVMDNHNGKGLGCRYFWINQICPVHGDRSMQYQIKNREENK